MGYYSRANVELCLLATNRRGKVLKRESKSVRQVVEEFTTEKINYPVTEHSRKPSVVRNRLVELFGDIPRIELFARGKVPEGWDAPEG
jgi:N6-adenosine-specific RNA methylase IME4